MIASQTKKKNRKIAEDKAINLKISSMSFEKLYNDSLKILASFILLKES